MQISRLLDKNVSFKVREANSRRRKPVISDAITLHVGTIDSNSLQRNRRLNKRDYRHYRSRTDNSARSSRLIYLGLGREIQQRIRCASSKQNRIVSYTCHLHSHLFLTPVNERTCVARRTRNASEEVPRRQHRLSRLPTPWRTVHQARISRNVFRIRDALAQLERCLHRKQDSSSIYISGY